MTRASGMAERVRRWGARVAALAALVGLGACDVPPEPTWGPPGSPLAGLSPTDSALFVRGRALFDTDVTDADGLGPAFNQLRCSSCHDLPTLGGSGVERVLKATRWVDGACSVLTEEGGDNVQPRITATARAVGATGETIPPSATHTVDLVAPALYGAGLLEAIPESTLLERADPDDADGDGISGRAGRDRSGAFARFGQKGTDASLRAFVEGALLQEMGITTSAYPDELTANGRPHPPGADPAPDPEFGPDQVAALVAYVRFLAPPEPEVPRTADDSAAVTLGLGLFHEVGCADCHVPTLTTAPDAPPPLDGRTVRLYSDLLLHDLGPDVAGICSPSASPTEVRTAPLMGLRLRPLLMHDGGAPNLGAVLERHGGEAAASRALVRRLSPRARDALLRFLSTL